MVPLAKIIERHDLNIANFNHSDMTQNYKNHPGIRVAATDTYAQIIYSVFNKMKLREKNNATGNLGRSLNLILRDSHY